MEKGKQKAIIFSGCVIVLFYCALQNISAIGNAVMSVFGVFSSFLLGAATAFVMNVPMRMIERRLLSGKWMEKHKKLRRALAYILALALVILIIVAVMCVVVPQIGQTISDLVKQFPTFIDNATEAYNDLLAAYPALQDYLPTLEVDSAEMVSNITGFLSTWSSTVLNAGINIISNVVSGITTGFLAFIFSVYILLQKETLARQGKKILYALLSKEKTERILEVLALTEKTFSGFISGQCLEVCILGSMFVVTMSIFGFPYAWLMGVIIAVTALIPIVGAYIGCIIGALLILTVNPIQSLLFIIMFVVLQQIEGNLIYPHVVGKSVGLPGLWVLLAVVVGGNMFGIPGMILFIPLFSVFYVLFGEFVNKRLEKKKIEVK